jgi:hypothetical protein
MLSVSLLSAGGCQTAARPVGETLVDQELAQPAPRQPPPEASQDEPRPGFEQESPKAQSQ